MQKIKLYSDGSSKGNPGKGGYGTVVKYFNDDYTKLERTDEYTEGFDLTTNNRMEILGVLIGLSSLTKPSEVIVCSDSKYVVNTFEEKWIDNWIKNDWVTKSNKPVKNVDLWKRMVEVMKPHKVSFVWIKGHNGHPENERCDYLATASADKVKMTKGEDGIYTLVKDSDDEKE